MNNGVVATEYFKRISINVNLKKEDGSMLFNGLEYGYCENNLFWIFKHNDIERALSLLLANDFLTEELCLKIQDELSGDFDTFVVCRV